MTWVIYGVCAVALLFGFVVFFGAPYVPTLRPQVKAALDLLNLQKGQTLIEVGSGDGRVLLAAAERGWQVVGYELNPLLVLWSRWKTRTYRKQVRIIWGNALTKQWPPMDAVYVFGVERIMTRLYKKVMQSTNDSVKIASFGFEIPSAEKVTTNQGVHLYIVKPKSS